MKQLIDSVGRTAASLVSAFIFVAGVVFVLLGLFLYLNAATINANAENIMHQLYASMEWLIALVSVIGGLVLMKLAMLNPPAAANGAQQDPAATEAIENISADLAWFKEVKIKEMKRAAGPQRTT